MEPNEILRKQLEICPDGFLFQGVYRKDGSLQLINLNIIEEKPSEGEEVKEVN